MAAISSAQLSSTLSPRSASTPPRSGLTAVTAPVMVGGDGAADAGLAAQTPTAPTSAAPALPDKAELDRQLQDLQLKMDKLNPALSFVLDPSSGRAVIQLTDRNTKELIQQFPAQAALQIAKALDRFEKGVVVRRTA